MIELIAVATAVLMLIESLIFCCILFFLNRIWKKIQAGKKCKSPIWFLAIIPTTIAYTIIFVFSIFPEPRADFFELFAVSSIFYAITGILLFIASNMLLKCYRCNLND